MLMYGSGLRVTECVSLRVKDVDLDRLELIVRGGKGGKDRRTPLAERSAEPLRRLLRARQPLQLADRRARIATTDTLFDKEPPAPTPPVKRVVSVEAREEEL